jgi:hypothetical protein
MADASDTSRNMVKSKSYLEPEDVTYYNCSGYNTWLRAPMQIEPDDRVAETSAAVFRGVKTHNGQVVHCK